MRRFFNILLGALALVAAALISAFVTMRLAIHGREVEIPNVAGLTVAEARSQASNLGLNVTLENHFYSTVIPAGRVLSQSPAPGTHVRREWVLRITESIGPQRVSVPNVVGKTEREASVTIRRLSLDLGTVAYIAAPGPAGIVLSQTPTPAAAGVDGPRISLLVSEPVPAVKTHPAAVETGDGDGAVPQAAPNQANSASMPGGSVGGTAESSASRQDAADHGAAAASAPVPASIESSHAEAYVMPDLMGLTLSAATARVAAMGLHITSMDAASAVVQSIAPVTAPNSPGSSGQPAPVRPIAPIMMSNTVIAQRPAAGRKVTRSATIHVTLSR